MQCLFFLSLALSCIPLSILLLALNHLRITLIPRNSVRHRLQKTPGFVSRTILLSGINTPQGLRLARAFYDTGHRVVGADYEPGGLPIHIRFSKALRRFYPLRLQSEERRAVDYIAALVQIIEQEHVDLWINCTSSVDISTDAQARAVIEQTTKCRCFALPWSVAAYFATRDAFLTYTKSQGLPVPEICRVQSRDEIHNVLHKAHGHRKYLLRSPHQNGLHVSSLKTILPSRTISQTYNTVSRITITKTLPWTLEQDTDGLERYSSFAIMVNGDVRAFVVSHPSPAGGHQILDPESALNQAMLRFMQTFARNQGREFTTHLGIDFCVEEHVTQTGVVKDILPVEVSTQAQPNVLLFRGIGGSAQLTRAYLASLAPDREDAHKAESRSALSVTENYLVRDVAVPVTTNSNGYYCFGQDFLNLYFTPLANLVTLKTSLIDYLQQLFVFIDHLLFWQDDAYSWQDLAPFWWSYQVYIPLRLIVTAISKQYGAPETIDQSKHNSDSATKSRGRVIGAS